MYVTHRAPVWETLAAQSERRERRGGEPTVLDSRSFRGRGSGEWKDEGPAGTKTKLKLAPESTQPIRQQ